MRQAFGRSVAQLAREAQLVYRSNSSNVTGSIADNLSYGFRGWLRIGATGRHGMHNSSTFLTEGKDLVSNNSHASSAARLSHQARSNSGSAASAAPSQRVASKTHPRAHKGSLPDTLYGKLDSLNLSGNTKGVRETFDVALKEAQVQMGKAESGAVPPPEFCSEQNWRLYFLALDQTGAHPMHVATRINTMHQFGVPPMEHAYWVLFRKCLAFKMGVFAFQKFAEMQELGISPSLSCYTTAIMACLKSEQLGYANRLLKMVAANDMSYNSQQLTNYGKVSMHAAREFARVGRFVSSLDILNDLEAKGLIVPHLLVTDIMHQAVFQLKSQDLLRCIQRLLRANQHFQGADGKGTIVRPLKMDEGSVLEVLEVAANQGDAELAEAAWELLTRSLALPNTPNFRGYQKGENNHADAEKDAGVGPLDDDLGPTGPKDPHQNEHATATPLQGQAVVVKSLDSQQQQEQQQHEQPQEQEQEQEGHVPRPPQVISYHALIHAMAKAHKFRRMFEAIRELQESHPHRPGALAYHEALQPAVDALAHGVDLIDEAYFVLEDMAKAGEQVTAPMLNVVVAACCQVGDIKRGLETFDQCEALGLQPTADSFNALLQGCVETGALDTMDKILEEMRLQEVPPNAHTHQLMVESHIVTADAAGMMAALASMEEEGHVPSTRLLERCVARTERAGDRENMRLLLERLFTNDYRIVGLDALVKRWGSEGGMAMLTGSSNWVSREELAPLVLSSRGRYHRPQWHSREGLSSPQ